MTLLSRGPFLVTRACSVLLVGLLSTTIFAAILTFDTWTDIPDHVRMLREHHARGWIPVPPFYYATIYAVALFSLDRAHLLTASAIVLTMSIVLKFASTRILVDHLVPPAGGTVSWGRLRIPRTAFVVSLLFVHPIAVLGMKQMYLGKIATSVWHNSTTIYLTPFAVLLFYRSLRYTESLRHRDLAWIVVLSILNVLIKPSFFVVFALSFPLFLLVTHGLRRKRELAEVALALAGVGAIVAAEYYYLFELGILDQVLYEGRKSEVIVAPFRVWALFSERKTLDFLASVAFPLSLVIVYRRRVWSNRVFMYSTATFLIALIVLILFAEQGPRLRHFNFLWQAIVSNYIYFTVCTALWMKMLEAKERRDPADYFVLVVFLAHLGSGLLYLYRSFTVGSFL